MFARQPSRDPGIDAIGGVPDINFLDPAFRADPYPALARLRRVDPVHEGPNGTWVITRHADVDALNRDPRLGRDLRRWGRYELCRPYHADSALERSVERWMLMQDPPDHTRLRAIAYQAFTPGAVAVLRPMIEATADRLLADLDGVDAFDYVASFSRPFLMRVMSEILSFPAADSKLLNGWGEQLMVILEPSISPTAKLLAIQAAAEMTEYLHELVREHRSDADDLLGMLIGGSREHGRLEDDEVVATTLMIFVTGLANTVIANGLYILLHHPEQFERVSMDGSVICTAVEELLRFDARGINARVTHEEIRVGDTVIEKGHLVFCMLGAANRDPAVFTDPDAVHVDRRPNPHLTFGGGIHHCFGSALTRLEAQVILPRLTRNWSSVEVDEAGVRWLDHLAIRGLDRLPLAVRR